MVHVLGVALITRIPAVAALKSDRDDVGCAFVMNASGLIIDRLAVDCDAADRPHRTAADNEISLSFGG